MNARRSVALLLLLALPAAALEPPKLALRGGFVEIAGLPPVLGEAAVAKQLESGLTTTFNLLAEVPGQAPGGARIEVRYDLWDEQYLATALGFDGKTEQARLASREALLGWWRELRLAVLPRSALPAPARGGQAPAARVRLTLEVIPFSQAEAADTQRWLSETLGRRGEARGGSLEEPAGAVGQVVSVLLATSIRRKAVASHQFQVEVAAGKAP